VNLTDAGRAERELRHALSSGRPELIARAVLANVWPLYCAHFELLTRTVEALPGPMLEQQPVLKVLHPMTPVLARVGRPFKPLVSPEEARTMTADELDILTLVQMVGFRFSGDVAAALVYARRLEDRIVEVRAASHERADGPLWFYHHQIGSTLLAAGDSSRALLAFTTARHVGRLSQQPDAERLALGRAALAHALRGSLEEAETALAEAARHPAPSPAHATSSRKTEQTAAALVAVERMTDDIDDHLARLEPFDSIDLTWPFALLARVRACIARQRPDDALEAVRLAGDAHPFQHGSTASDVLCAASIDALWALGETPRARRTAAAAPTVGPLTKMATIRLALLGARADAAARGIRDLSQDATLGPGPRAELLLLSTWHDLQTGDEVQPEAATRIGRLAETRNVRRLLATMPRQLIDAVRDRLPAGERAALDDAVRGLGHVDLPRRPALTGSEARVLNALPLHRSTAELAAALHVSPNTIKTQLRSLYRKLGCTNRSDAIEVAVRLRLTGMDAE
jgi:ATP/maltotriose-dependent transcriptional regulator MalT